MKKQRQKKLAWLFGLLVTMLLVVSGSAGANANAPDKSGVDWDRYVSSNPTKFEEKTTEKSPSAFSVQQIPITKGMPDLSQPKLGRSLSAKARYTVLVIDTSGSMSGKPMVTAKAAASKFVKQLLASQGENDIAIVGFSDSGTAYSAFSRDTDTLDAAINNMGAIGGTATDQGLLAAESLFKRLDKTDVIKNIVVLSDGEPNSETAALKVADRLKADKQNIYSLGFFHNLSGAGLTRARTFMDRLQNAGYYDVTSSDALDFEFDKISDDINERSNIFKYPSSDKQSKESDTSAVYYYKDAYFKKTGYQYNEQLATMSLSLALSAFGSLDVGTDYENKSNNAKNILSEIGFTAIKTNDWFSKKPSQDSIGVIAGHKKIKEAGKPYTLIALAIRGGGYESEWASNFTIGKDGDHTGFSQARDQVLDFLKKEYIEENGISGDIKLWITGYSRAGATANLVAGKIDEGVTLANCSLKKSDLYAYTFEAPAGAKQKKEVNIKTGIYKNIFNTVNLNDPVPRVAPKEWDFTRYGVDQVLPTKERTNEKSYARVSQNMQNRFTDLAPTTPYLIDEFAMKKIDWYAMLSGGKPFISTASQSVFLDDFISVIATETFKNRTNYNQHFESPLRQSLAAINGTENTPTMLIVINKLTELIFYQKASAIKYLTSTNELEKLIKKTLRDLGIPYKAEEIEPLNRVIKSFTRHPVMLYTLKTQGESIAQGHMPELCLSWLQSQDNNYVTGGKASFSSGNYRIIRINYPVDVQVYNSDNTLVSAIINDEPQAVSSLVSAINENGEKLLYLPPDGDYTVKTRATADGKMSYSINEYSYEAGEVRKVQNYDDLPLEKEKVYVGQVPAYSASALAQRSENGTDTAYSLKDEAANKVLTPSVGLAGEAAVAAKFTVTATSQNETQGVVFGGGEFQVGSFVQLTALPNEGNSFIGWYQDGKRVSSEPVYRFRVGETVTLIARFKPETSQATTAYNQAHGNFDPDKQVIEAGDWSTFIAAYQNEAVTKIVLTKDIVDTSPTGAKGPTNYKRRKSIEIDGQNHSLTLKQYHSLQTSEQANTYTEQVAGKQVNRSLFYMHDISLLQNLNGAGAKSGDYSSLAFVGALDSGKSTGKKDDKRKSDQTKNWYFRFGNIDTQKSDNKANNLGLTRLVTAYGAEVTLYGQMKLRTTAENMYVGALTVEDGTIWTGVSDDQDTSLVWFTLSGQKDTTGQSEALSIGENSQIDLKNTKYGKSYPAFYGNYKQAVIGKQTKVTIEMLGNAWRFDQNGSALVIKDGATLNLKTTGKSKVLQFGGTAYLSRGVRDCTLKVEPGGSLFISGETGASVIDFSGRYDAKNCTIELDQPKAYDFINKNKSRFTSRQSVLNLRHDSNQFRIKNTDIAIWRTDRKVSEVEKQVASQKIEKAKSFVLIGNKQNKHSQDILKIADFKSLKGKEIRRIGN